MFLTVHAASGLVIGKYVDSSILAFLFGFISHLLLDMVPGHDPIELKKWKKPFVYKNVIIVFFIELPLILTMLLLLNLFNKLIISWPMFWAVSGALAMDFLWGLYFLTKWKFLKIFSIVNHWSHEVFSDKLYVSWKIWLPMQLFVLAVLLFIYLL